MKLAFLADGDDASVFQCLDVVGNGGLGERELVADVRTSQCAGIAQAGDHLATRWVGQCLSYFDEVSILHCDRCGTSASGGEFEQWPCEW